MECNILIKHQVRDICRVAADVKYDDFFGEYLQMSIVFFLGGGKYLEELFSWAYNLVAYINVSF